MRCCNFRATSQVLSVGALVLSQKAGHARQGGPFTTTLACAGSTSWSKNAAHGLTMCMPCKLHLQQDGASSRALSFIVREQSIYCLLLRSQSSLAKECDSHLCRECLCHQLQCSSAALRCQGSGRPGASTWPHQTAPSHPLQARHDVSTGVSLWRNTAKCRLTAPDSLHC